MLSIIFCSSLILSSETRAELTLFSLLWLDFLEPFNETVPETVGTALDLSLGLALLMGGGGREGALGGGGCEHGLLMFWLEFFSRSLVRNVSDRLPLPRNGILKVHGWWFCGLLLMIRRSGMILFDFVLRMNIAVEMKTVSPTNMLMIPVTMPRAFIGLSLLCIKKAAIGPLS